MAEANSTNASEEKSSASDIEVTRVKENSAILIAVIGLASAVIGYYFNYLITRTQIELPLAATVTAAAKPAASIKPPNAQPTSDVFLSEFVEIADFDEGNSEGWRPFAWDSGWVDYVDSGNVEVVESDFVLDGHSGPFLKYPLELKAEDIYASTIRNAIYKPTDKKIIGIIANVFYESDPHYSLEEIRAGFVVPFRVGDGELLRNEDYLKKLTPNKWNTIIWSLYGPVWWDSKDKDQAWNSLKDLFGDGAYNLQVGRHLYDVKIEKIGIQFIVNSEGGPKEFKGTAYIDNIVLVYEHP